MFALASSGREPERLVLAGTAAGLHRSLDGGRTWQLLSGETSGFPVLAIALAPGYPADPRIWIGGAPGVIMYSLNGGRTWASSPLEYPDAMVNVLAVSPSFAEDGVILAGTLDDGLYRSNFRGQHWEATNFGLYDLSVWDLALSPAWKSDQTAFAVVGNRVLRSTNGARAWKAPAEGIEEFQPQVVAVSPDFARDHLVLLGTAGHGVWRSADRGSNWRPVKAAQVSVVNCLAFSSSYALDHTVYAGTADGVLWSQDPGEHWERLGELDAPVLGLTEVDGEDGRVLLASHPNGLWRLELGKGPEPRRTGRAWTRSDEGLAARAITMLATAAAPLADSVLAAAGEDGLWLASEAGGHGWKQVATGMPDLGMQCVAALIALSPEFPRDGVALLGGARGILRTADGGLSWELSSLRGDWEGAGAIAVSPGFPVDQKAWACTGHRLIRSTDSGRSWAAAPVPAPGQSIVSLALSPFYEHDRTLVVGTRASEQGANVLRLWRSTDDGLHWASLWEQRSSAPQIVVAVPAGAARARGPFVEVFVGMGNEVFWPSASGAGSWQSRKLPDSAARVLSLLVLGRPASRRTVVAGTSRGLFVSSDGGNRWWQPAGGPEKLPIAALAAPPGQASGQGVWVLGVGGDLWWLDGIDDER